MQLKGEPSEVTPLENFRAYLDRLVEQFRRNISQYKSKGYDEASLRQEFLNPFFRALGWDVENKTGLIPSHREVEIESRTEIAGRQKRADYLFRIDRQDRFVCEAKKPAENLDHCHAFQAKRYAWNKGLVLAVLTNFEETRVYIVGSKPYPEEVVEVGLWKKWEFQKYPLFAQEIWELLAQTSIAGGSIEKLVEQLPRRPAAKGKARQQWLFKPDRSRALDTDFLNFLDEARRDLASDLIRHNDRADLLEGTRLNEAVQHILDRLLFLRICDDRDIDTGRPLALILRSWRGNPDEPIPPRKHQSELIPGENQAPSVAAPKTAQKRSLWREIVTHFRALDRRPPSFIPYFNGNLFKPHFSEELDVSDVWISDFLDDVGDENSPYLFNVIPVEILGIIYERFLGKVVLPKGRGVIIEEKPEVRKAGGVYYTPRYIVDYIVEQTVGKLLADVTPKASLELRVLDPACGSGSFLIRAFERICEHWQIALTENQKARRRQECWVDPKTGDVHLTTDLKRRILTANIYGVDIDPGAVEVTQLSLYLKMLEGENRTTMARDRDLFGNDVAILPPLEANIMCGNSLIASDFSLLPEDLVRVHAYDWPVQFPKIIKAGGFDAIVGNPPWVSLTGKFGNDICSKHEIAYLMTRYHGNTYMPNLYEYFVSQGFNLVKAGGEFGLVVPDRLGFNAQFVDLRKRILTEASDIRLRYKVPFPGITADTLIFALCKTPPSNNTEVEIVEHGKQPTKRSQADILANPSHAFEYFEDASVMKMIKKLKGLPHVKSVAELCQSTSGFGGKSNLITEERRNKRQIQTIKGESIRRYETRKYYWFDFCRENITGRTTDRAKLGAIPKVLLRKTGASIIATYDESGIFPEQSLYFFFNNKSALNLKFVLGVLNSKILNTYFQATCLTNKNSIAQVKKVDLDSLPIPVYGKGSPLTQAKHDRLVVMVDKMLALSPRLRVARSDSAQATLKNAISATNQQIDALVYELYGLTPQEIDLVEKS